MNKTQEERMRRRHAVIDPVVESRNSSINSICTEHNISLSVFDRFYYGGNTNTKNLKKLQRLLVFLQKKFYR